MLWRCLRCDHLHACNPSECADCGYSILEPDLTADETNVSPPEPVSDAIKDAVAEVKDVHHDDLHPLTDVIDPDAVESIIHRTRSGGSQRHFGRIQFQYDGFDVVVHQSGAIDIEPADGE